MLLLLQLVLSFPMAGAPPVALPEPETATLESGRRLVESGQVNQALQVFDAYKQKHPLDIRPYLFSAQALIQAGRLRDAGLELDEAASRQPSTPADILEYARARAELGQLHEAVRALSEVGDSPDLPAEGLWLLSDFHYRLKQAKEAMRVLDKFSARHAADPRLKLRRGQVFIYLEEFEKALTSLEEATWADPHSAEAHFEMARTLRYGLNPEAGKKAARKAVDLAPDNPEYLHLLGLLCDDLKQHEEAVGYLQKAADSPQAFARIYFDLGNALRKAGETANAQEVLKKYRELLLAQEEKANDDKKIEALVNQGQLQIRSGNAAEGLSSFQRILEIDPNNWLAHSFLVKIYLSSGRPFLAREHLERMERIDPNSSEGAFLAAFYWYKQGNLTESLRYGNKSKELRPGDPELRNLLGNIYFSRGEMEAAVKEYGAAVALAPDRFDFKANYETALKQVNP